MARANGAEPLTSTEGEAACHTEMCSWRQPRDWASTRPTKHVGSCLVAFSFEEREASPDRSKRCLAWTSIVKYGMFSRLREAAALVMIFG